MKLSKVKNDMSNQIVCKVFPNRNITYNLKLQSDFSLPYVYSSYGLKLFKCFVANICDAILSEVKEPRFQIKQEIKFFILFILIIFRSYLVIYSFISKFT